MMSQPMGEAFASYLAAYQAIVSTECLRVPEKVAVTEELTDNLHGCILTPAQTGFAKCSILLDKARKRAYAYAREKVEMLRLTGVRPSLWRRPWRS
jgi:hypothetical protein